MTIKGNNLYILSGNGRRNYSAFNYEIHTISDYAVIIKNGLEPHIISNKMIKTKLLCIGNKQTTYLEKYILSLKCSSHFKKIINVGKGLYILYICIFVFIYLYICLYICIFYMSIKTDMKEYISNFRGLEFM